MTLRPGTCFGPYSIVELTRSVRSALFLIAISVFAQPVPVFHAGISLVHVDVEVIADGRILAGFVKDDFRVLDQGTPQRIVNFSAEEQPLDLILLFNISASMRPVVQRVALAARQGLEELRPGDRVSVMVFNTRTRVMLPFTEDLALVERAIQQDVLGRRFGGGTFIQQAVDDAAQRFISEPRGQRRRAVLIVTDNVGARTRHEESVVRDFWEADALLSGLIIRGGLQKGQIVRMVLAPQVLLIQAGMQGIAEKTGGDAIRSDDPGPAFQEMMHRIRNRYSLYYEMPSGKPGTARNIRVELSEDAQHQHPDARVRARHGYRIPLAKGD